MGTAYEYILDLSILTGLFSIISRNLISLLINIFFYCNNPKYWDRQSWANHVNQDQTPQNVESNP